MLHTQNLNLALYEGTDKMNITGESDSLNANMEIIDGAIAGKQDAISDLAAIREGASKGNTALQEHQDISGKQDVISDLAAIREGAAKGNAAQEDIDELRSDVSDQERRLSESINEIKNNYKATSMTLIKSKEPITVKTNDGLTGYVEVKTGSHRELVNILIHDTVSAGIKNDSGIDVSDGGSRYWAEYTPVVPNEVLTVDYGAQRIYQYDESKNWLRRTATHSFSSAFGQFVVPSDCHFIQIQFSLNTSAYNAQNPNVIREVVEDYLPGTATVTCVNKNLLDSSSYTQGIKNDSGTLVTDSSRFFDKYIAVIPNEKLYFNFGAQRVYQYDADKNWLRRTASRDVTTKLGLFTVPADCRYIQVQYATSSVNLDNAQIERGSTETSYVEHKENGVELTNDNNSGTLELYQASSISNDKNVELSLYVPSTDTMEFSIPVSSEDYDYWEPSDVTDAYKCTPLGQATQSIPAISSTLKYQGFLDEYYNIYLGEREDGYRVTRTDMGLDSGAAAEDHFACPIYSYEFVPKKYTKTVLLSAGMNTCEASTYFGLAYFIKSLMEKAEDGMRALYNSVRFIVIPVICPSGMLHDPLLYPNSNNVRINKNFEHAGSWDRLKTDRGGPYPDSEVETKILKYWLNKYQGADFWLDCHSDTAASTIREHLSTIFISDTNTRNIFDSDKSKILNFYTNKGYFSDPSSVQLYFYTLGTDTSPYPKTNYAYDICGIPSAMMEQYQYSTAWGSDGNTNNDSYAIKHYTAMIRYLVLEIYKRG